MNKGTAKILRALALLGAAVFVLLLATEEAQGMGAVDKDVDSSVARLSGARQ